jgi:hypothetical protein
MANLQDVNYSMHGEQKNSQEKPVDKLSGSIKYAFNGNGEITNVPEKEWYVFKLLDNTKKGGVYIPNIDDVWNPKTKQVERIRLLAGVPSIWVKDQEKLTPEYIKQNGISLQFHRGQKMMRIAAHNTTALEFCRLTNSNVGNPKRVKNSRFEFFEYDFAAAETEAFEKETFELEMAILAKEEKVDAMKKHAAFLGIRLISDLGETKSPDGIRREYVMYAKRNPKYFKETRNTPQIEITWLVKKAISETLIDIGREPGKIFWSKGGGMICVCPQSIKPEQYLVELAMTNNEEGKLFKEQLQKAIT